ncbi:hypothetical protein PVAND_017591 [Polypedilum vanderplanki]|uniref:Uncharacterized protein n=1 Tax=Polypedilum vanderplanki TaxID=319348 RepID=A0A9J6B9K7_POLVA|nr:hypothetical protein PVAND_017591 [Polypedilum vanderplanki]
MERIRIPLGMDPVQRVNESLRQISNLAAPRVLIYEKEVNYFHFNQALNDMMRYERRVHHDWGLITCLRNFGKVDVPSFVTVACRPTFNDIADAREAGESFEWHVIVVGRYRNIGIIFEPNFDQTFPDHLHDLEGREKIRAVFEMLNLRPGLRTPARIFVGGGGNFDSQCRKFSFNFLKDFTTRYLQLPINTEIDQHFIYGDHPFKEIRW